VEDDDEGFEYSVSWGGTCVCDHEADEHGWGSCDVDGCPCEAGWEE
jgi:hypothetical protein